MSFGLLITIVIGSVIFGTFVLIYSMLYIGAKSDERLNKIMEEDNEW